MKLENILCLTPMCSNSKMIFKGHGDFSPIVIKLQGLIVRQKCEETIFKDSDAVGVWCLQWRRIMNKQSLPKYVSKNFF